MSPRQRLRLRVVLALAAAAGASLATEAGAVPAFARRYGTSCQTCHVAFPKNTPFGDAFRRNGHRFPDGSDADMRRDEPQKLGADAYKDVFPDSVWPGELPAHLPLSLVLHSTVAVRPEEAEELSFAGLGGAAALNAAASLGDWLSAWAGWTVSTATTGDATLSTERVFLTVTPWERPWAVLRVGRFEPGLSSVSMHRLLGPAPWLTTTPVEDDPFTLEPAKHGLELSGVAAAGRASWSAGVVEGGGARATSAKDFYGSVGYKLGGLRLDGVTEAEPGADGGAAAESTGAANPAPWREWSVRVGAFGWSGLARVGDGETARQDDRIRLGGAELNAQLRDANLVFAYTYARHDRPSLVDPADGREVRQALVQLDYVVFPWLVPVVRYERRIVGAADADRASAVLYALLRANVRTQLQATVERTGSDAFELTLVSGGLSVGF